MNDRNTHSPSGQPGNSQRPQVDKTMVEGAQPPASGTAFAQTRPGTRLNATSLGNTNPYGGQQNPSRGYQDLLPSGNENIPLGSGRIIGLLGTGGMARVYKIWNEKLEIFRAVKILIPTQQADLANRFETEAKITAKVRHPNIVEIYSVGDFDAGTLKLPYLEMEYIDGETLESMVSRQGKLPDAVCCAIAMAVVHALSYAHGQEFLLYGKTYKGIIHRDLKPANIMISLQGNIKLMDFGIARPTEASLHTVDGNIVGTMQYLSPEQLDGVDIDCRTDIYSFGAILYEIITGTKTFPQDTITNLMRKKITNTYRKFNDFDFAISKDLSRVAQKCLELSKEHRYASADELGRDLESVFRSMTDASPAEIMRQYLANPAAFATTRHRAGFPVLKPIILIPAIAVIIVAAVITTILVTGPSQPAPVATVSTPVAPVAPPPPVTTLPTQEEIRPLGPAATPAVKDKIEETTEPAIRSKSTKTTQPPIEKKPVKSAAAPPAPAKPKSTSPLDALKTRYNSEDLVAIGQNAAGERDYAGAITALENVPPGHPKQTLRVLLLLEAYIETGKLSDAQALITGAPINDAQYDILCGRLYQAQGKDKKALNLYQSGMIKPSIVRNMKQIRQDALFFTAVVWTDHYRKSPSSDSRMQASNAWTAVQRLYTDNQGHPRYAQASTELGRLQ